MFERFTDRARRVIVVSQDEAKNLHHDFIAPEHLLLGLAQGDGVAARALAQLGVSADQLRAKVDDAVQRPKMNRRGSKVPFSPKAKKALELSLREALRLGHNYIGTEHLVLGVLGVLDEGAVIELLGVDAGKVCERVFELLPNGSVSDMSQSQSPATADTMRRARQLAASGPMTTGHLLNALLADTESQASRALGALGVTAESLAPQLSAIRLDGTSDAPPRPQTVEIKLGETTTTIGDPELAARLGELSPEQLGAALREALGGRRNGPPAGSARAS